MSKTEVAKPLIQGMKRRPDAVHSAAEAIHKMMEAGSPEIVLQSIQSGLVKFLLQLLESPLSEVEKPSATKAVIAETLKLMAKDLANGENVCKEFHDSLVIICYLIVFVFVIQVNEILSNSKVWSAYKDQKHDLFITENTVAGYLTAGSMGGVAGYLTAGSGLTTGGTSAMSSPPPLLAPPADVEDKDDDD